MLKLFCTWVVALTALTGIANAQDANEKAKKGAAAYQLCAACHRFNLACTFRGQAWRTCGADGSQQYPTLVVTLTP
jgi:cytochrome c553